jgi:hypothetical protein
VAAGVLGVELFALLFLGVGGGVGFWDVALVAKRGLYLGGDLHLCKELGEDAGDHAVFEEDVWGKPRVALKITVSESGERLPQF